MLAPNVNRHAIAWVVVVALAAAPAVAAESAVVVVGEGVRAADLVKLDGDVRAAVTGAQAADVTNARMASAAAHGLRCDVRAVDCLVQTGVVCGVDKVILADVDGSRLALTVVDVAEGRAIHRAIGTVDHIAAAVSALAAPSSSATRLEVNGAPPVSVSVDDGKPAPAPFVRTDVAAGSHVLRYDAPGHVARTETVIVLLGEPTHVVASAGPPVPAASTSSTSPSSAPSASSSSAATTSAGPSSSLWIASGGAAVLALGVAAVVVGIVPYAQRGAAGDQLRVFAAAPGTLDAATVKEIQGVRRQYDGADASWQSWGAPVVGVGLVLVGLGAGAAAAALLTGE